MPPSSEDLRMKKQKKQVHDKYVPKYDSSKRKPPANNPVPTYSVSPPAFQSTISPKPAGIFREREGVGSIKEGFNKEQNSRETMNKEPGREISRQETQNSGKDSKENNEKE